MNDCRPPPRIYENKHNSDHLSDAAVSCKWKTSFQSAYPANKDVLQRYVAYRFGNVAGLSAARTAARTVRCMRDWLQLCGSGRWGNAEGLSERGWEGWGWGGGVRVRTITSRVRGVCDLL